MCLSRQVARPDSDAEALAADRRRSGIQPEVEERTASRLDKGGNGMRRYYRSEAVIRLAAAVAVLLASMSAVVWRRGRTLEALALSERLNREISLAEAELNELQRRIQHLESYGRVVLETRARLGMKTAGAEDIVLLPGELR